MGGLLVRGALVGGGGSSGGGASGGGVAALLGGCSTRSRVLRGGHSPQAPISHW